MKTVAKVLAGAVILAMLLWTTTFLYWHLRITSAIREIEKNPSMLHVPALSPQLTAMRILMNSGCRAMPDCVRAIDSSNDLILNNEMIGLIRSKILAGGHVVVVNTGPVPFERVDEETRADEEFVRKCEILEKDTPDMRALRCRRLHEWWREKGPIYHQWWRVWSSRCNR